MGDELPTSTGDRRISEPSRVFGLKPNALNIWKHFNMKISRTEFPVYMETRQRQRNCDIQLLQTVTCHSFSDRDRYHEPWWEHLNSNNSSNFQGDEKCEWRGYHNLTPQLHTGMIPLLFSIFVFGHSSPSHTWRPSSYPWQRNDGQSHGRTLRLFHSKESLKEAWEVRNSLRGSLPKNWHRIRLLELFYWNFWVPFRTTQSMLEIDRYIIYIYIHIYIYHINPHYFVSEYFLVLQDFSILLPFFGPKTLSLQFFNGQSCYFSLLLDLSWSQVLLKKPEVKEFVV